MSILVEDIIVEVRLEGNWIGTFERLSLFLVNSASGTLQPFILHLQVMKHLSYLNPVSITYNFIIFYTAVNLLGANDI